MDPNDALTWSQLFSGLAAIITVLVLITGVAFAVRRSMRKKENAEAGLAEAQTQKILADSMDEPSIMQITAAYQRLMDSHVATIESHEHTITDMELRLRNLEAEVNKLWADNGTLRTENTKCTKTIHNLEKINKELQHKIDLQDSISMTAEVLTATNIILGQALSSDDLLHQLQTACDALLGITWLQAFKVCLFTIDKNDANTLVLVVQRGVHNKTVNSCYRVSLGECFCGQAAEQKRIMFFSADMPHGKDFHASSSHGHYCVPLVKGIALLGLISIYVDADKEPHKNETHHLTHISSVIVDLIIASNKREEKEEKEDSDNAKQVGETT